MSSLTKSYNAESVRDEFIGIHHILPGQFNLLDNNLMHLSKDHLKIIMNTKEKQVFDYNVNSIKNVYYKNELLPAIEIRLSNLNRFNINQDDELMHLLETYLHLRTPSTVFITYNKELDTFALKNMNGATVILTRKI